MKQTFKPGEIVEFWEFWGGQSQLFRGQVEEVLSFNISISTNFGKTFDVDPRMVHKFIR